MPGVESLCIERGIPSDYAIARAWMGPTGDVTPLGQLALTDHYNALHDDALRRNALPAIGADGLAILGKFVAEEELTDLEYRQARRIELSACLRRLPGGELQLTDHGRKVWSLAKAMEE